MFMTIILVENDVFPKTNCNKLLMLPLEPNCHWEERFFLSVSVIYYKF